MGGILFNLLVGVVGGLLADVLFLWGAVMRFKVDIAPQDAAFCVKLEGVASFLQVPKLTHALAQIPAGHGVRITDRTSYMDTAVVGALRSFAERRRYEGTPVDWPQAAPQRVHTAAR